MKYAYMRDGTPLVNWRGRNAAPMQSRAADTVALGSLEGTTLDEPTLVLPAPGAPEPLNGVSCKCGGSCGCQGSGLGAITDLFALPGGWWAWAGSAYLAYRLLKKKR